MAINVIRVKEVETVMDTEEKAVHEEINRQSRERWEKNQAAEVEERRERADRAYRNRQRAKRERFKLFLHRIALCGALEIIAVSWGVVGIINTPFALVGVGVATIWAICEVRHYTTVGRWSK